MRRIGSIILLFIVVLNTFGQSSEEQSKPNLVLNLDVLSSHLWRGFKNGNSYSIQPTVSFNYKGLSTGAWAAIAGNDSYFEVDLFTEYSYHNVTLSLYDYYCPPSTQMNSFGEFRKHHTKHTLDAMLSWTPDSIPFKIMVSTLILGDDLSKTSRKQSYSTYIEPAYVWYWKRFSGDLFVGFTPFEGYYASKPSVVNVGATFCYNLRIQNFELPLQAKVSHNPILESTWIMLGVSLSIN